MRAVASNGGAAEEIADADADDDADGDDGRASTIPGAALAGPAPTATPNSTVATPALSTIIATVTASTEVRAMVHVS